MAMKVLGFSDEITVCDCCGKTNLSGTFGVETDAGDVLHYGSVCVNKVYGKKRGTAIKFEAKAIGRLQSVTWDRAIDLFSRGQFPNFIGAKMGDKTTSNNSKAQMDAVTRFFDYRTGETIRARI
jgi:hypothetical protein